MFIDELRDDLKKIKPDINTIKKFWGNSGKEELFERLSKISAEEDFWQNKEQTTILKQLQALKNLRNEYLEVIGSNKELEELIDIFKDDENELKNIEVSITQNIKAIKKLKIKFLLQGENDNNNCFIDINAGAGGTESQDWTEMLLRMLIRFSERESLKAKIIHIQTGETAGIKSATIFVEGRNAYGFLKNEQGIHRLVRISPFDASKRRHTSFAGILVTAEIEKSEIIINPEDLRIDTYRASGAGGQHVNTTDSAVRITHTPTGIIVQCQNERSQLQNKETAMKFLKAKLIKKQKDDEQAKLKAVEKKKIEWGSQIRSYILHPYKMVKDHRTNFESSQPDRVLDGDLMPFIEANLIRLGRK